MRGHDLDDFSTFLKEFQDETDRGAALVGAALIDQKLKKTLAAFFADPDVGSELLDPVGNGPLSSMVARSKIALCLGLIDRDEFEECKLISKKIRNAFAHWTHGTTFRHPEIVKHCVKLRARVPTDSPLIKENPRLLSRIPYFSPRWGSATAASMPRLRSGSSGFRTPSCESMRLQVRHVRR